MGELIAAGKALAEDGTSRALGAGEIAEADPDLTRRLVVALAGDSTPLVVVSTDLFYES